MSRISSKHLREMAERVLDKSGPFLTDTDEERLAFHVIGKVKADDDESVTRGYRWAYGWTCNGRKDFEFMSDAKPRYFNSVIDAVADWMGRNGHPWPVTVSESV